MTLLDGMSDGVVVVFGMKCSIHENSTVAERAPCNYS